ncbi:MAG: hypothetical protein PVSMB8_09390 [Vulcanimicrobiaceae bacterium]
MYQRFVAIVCTTCRHPADLHSDRGCVAYERGDNMSQPRPCPCATVITESTPLRSPVPHLRLL